MLIRAQDFSMINSALAVVYVGGRDNGRATGNFAHEYFKIFSDLYGFTFLTL